jgi:hypothetical protein
MHNAYSDLDKNNLLHQDAFVHGEASMAPGLAVLVHHQRCCTETKRTGLMSSDSIREESSTGLDYIAYQVVGVDEAKEWSKSGVVPMKLLQDANRGWDSYTDPSKAHIGTWTRLLCCVHLIWRFLTTWDRPERRGGAAGKPRVQA